MTEDEIRQMCKKNWYDENLINEWIDNTQKIADLCDAQYWNGTEIVP